MRITGTSGASLLRVATVALRFGVTAIKREGRATRRGVTPARDASADPTALIYELLDAHYDTAELAEGLEYDEAWAAHLDYLRALQRTGREILARMPAGDAPPARVRRTLGDPR